MQTEKEPERPPAALVMRLYHAARQPVSLCKSLLATLSGTEQERYVVYLETRVGFGFRDPLEANPQYTTLLEQVGEEAQAEADAYRQRREEELRASGDEDAGFLARRGLCYVRWAAMKRLLNERHGLEWKTPAEMNPSLHFS